MSSLKLAMSSNNNFNKTLISSISSENLISLIHPILIEIFYFRLLSDHFNHSNSLLNSEFSRYLKLNPNHDFTQIHLLFLLPSIDFYNSFYQNIYILEMYKDSGAIHWLITVLLYMIKQEQEKENNNEEEEENVGIARKKWIFILLQSISRFFSPSHFLCNLLDYLATNENLLLELDTAVNNEFEIKEEGIQEIIGINELKKKVKEDIHYVVKYFKWKNGREIQRESNINGSKIVENIRNSKSEGNYMSLNADTTNSLPSCASLSATSTSAILPSSNIVNTNTSSSNTSAESSTNNNNDSNIHKASQSASSVTSISEFSDADMISMDIDSDNSQQLAKDAELKSTTKNDDATKLNSINNTNNSNNISSNNNNNPSNSSNKRPFHKTHNYSPELLQQVALFKLDNPNKKFKEIYDNFNITKADIPKSTFINKVKRMKLAEEKRKSLNGNEKNKNKMEQENEKMNEEEDEQEEEEEVSETDSEEQEEDSEEYTQQQRKENQQKKDNNDNSKNTISYSPDFSTRFQRKYDYTDEEMNIAIQYKFDHPQLSNQKVIEALGFVGRMPDSTLGTRYVKWLKKRNTSNQTAPTNNSSNSCISSGSTPTTINNITATNSAAATPAVVSCDNSNKEKETSNKRQVAEQTATQSTIGSNSSISNNLIKRKDEVYTIVDDDNDNDDSKAASANTDFNRSVFSVFKDQLNELRALSNAEKNNNNNSNKAQLESIHKSINDLIRLIGDNIPGIIARQPYYQPEFEYECWKYIASHTNIQNPHQLKRIYLALSPSTQINTKPIQQKIVNNTSSNTSNNSNAPKPSSSASNQNTNNSVMINSNNNNKNYLLANQATDTTNSSGNTNVIFSSSSSSSSLSTIKSNNNLASNNNASAALPQQKLNSSNPNSNNNRVVPTASSIVASSSSSPSPSSFSSHFDPVNYTKLALVIDNMSKIKSYPSHINFPSNSLSPYVPSWKNYFECCFKDLIAEFQNKSFQTNRAFYERFHECANKILDQYYQAINVTTAYNTYDNQLLWKTLMNHLVAAFEKYWAEEFPSHTPSNSSSSSSSNLSKK